MSADAAARLEPRPPSEQRPNRATSARTLRATPAAPMRTRSQSERAVRATPAVPMRARSMTARIREVGSAAIPRGPAVGTPRRSASAPVPQQRMKVDLKLKSKEARDALFSRLDADGSGRLTLKEIDVGLRREYKALDALIKAKSNGNHILKRAHVAAEAAIGSDSAGHADGKVTREEFRVFVEYVEFFANLWDAFETIDANHDGKLNLQEFEEGFDLIEPESTLTRDELALEFQHVDKDGSGVISKQEFCTWMARRRHAPKVHARQREVTRALELVLSCRGLETVKGIDIGSMYTKAVVSEVKRVSNPRAPKDKHGVPIVSARELTYEPLGYTEVVKHCRTPRWTQFVDVELKEASNPLYQQQIRIAVFLVNAKGHHIRELGFVTVGLEDLYRAKWRRMTLTLQSRGEHLSNVASSASDKGPRISVCAVEKAPSRLKAWVRMQFQATNLQLNELRPGQSPTQLKMSDTQDTPRKTQRSNTVATDGHPPLSTHARRPTTYLQVSRQLQGFLQPFYRSELIENNCNPRWEDLGVSFQQMCAGDENCQLLIELYKVDEVTLPSGVSVHVCEQRDELQLGQVQLSAKAVFEAGRAHKAGNFDGSTFTMEPICPSLNCPLLTVLHVATYYPEKGTQRKELHLEDKHFAFDREFLSELLGANAVTSDVAEKIDEAQRYVELCAQAWITRRKEDAERNGMRSSRKARRQHMPVLYDQNGRVVEKSDVDTGMDDVNRPVHRTTDRASNTSDDEQHPEDHPGVQSARKSVHMRKLAAAARSYSGIRKVKIEHTPRHKVSQLSKFSGGNPLAVASDGSDRTSQRVNLRLPSSEAFAKGSKAERMAILGLKELQKHMNAARPKKHDPFKIDPQVRAVLDKAGSQSWLKTPASGVYTPRALSAKKKSPSPGDASTVQQSEAEHVRVSGHLISKENDHASHYEDQLGQLADGTRLMSSTLEHKRLKSPRWAHTNTKLYSKNRLGDEWRAAAATRRTAAEPSGQGTKMQIDTPNRKPLYAKPEPKPLPETTTLAKEVAGKGNGSRNPYAAVKTSRSGGTKKKHKPLGPPACAMIPTGQQPPTQRSERNQRTTDPGGSICFSRRPAAPAAYGGRADVPLARKVNFTKAEKAEKSRKLEEAKERRGIGKQQLIDWLSEIEQLHLLSTFQREGFNSLAEVRNADLGQEDLAMLGIAELDRQQIALEMLASRYAELGEKCAKQIAMGFAKLDKRRGKMPNLADVGLLHVATASAQSRPQPKPEPELQLD